ncbi:MAG: 2Fe-2S iron-sulfur cluster binding domain-containing protein [Hyphomonadaceae bacterium]|nr:2Fe-2S iron-sulfur cluster binding domain-containing protein [Hyphomonadaceae bacterium]
MTDKVRIRIVGRSGVETAAEGALGASLMETIRKHGFDELLAICGGCCSCATCHVFVDPGSAQGLPEMSWEEEMLLEGSSHFCDRSRLSCQIKLAPEHEGLRVVIAPED